MAQSSHHRDAAFFPPIDLMSACINFVFEQIFSIYDMRIDQLYLIT